MRGSIVRPDGSIRLECHHDSTEQCYVAGTFSDWKPTEMTRDAEGWWCLDIPTHRNTVLEYKFMADGEWFNDPLNYSRGPDRQNSLLYTGRFGGTVYRRWFSSPSLGRIKSYTIYMPPAYRLYRGQFFPVLFMFGGLFEDDTGWIEKGDLPAVVDSMLHAEEIGSFLVVMPDKDDSVFEPEDWSRYESYLATDLIDHVATEYRVTRLMGFEGLSLGGAWALKMALRFPHQTASISCLSSYIDDGLLESFADHAPLLRANAVRVRLACGETEHELAHRNGQFQEFLKGAGIASENFVNPGEHDWPLWQMQMRFSLKFHWHSFSLKGAAPNWT